MGFRIDRDGSRLNAARIVIHDSRRHFERGLVNYAQKRDPGPSPSNTDPLTWDNSDRSRMRSPTRLRVLKSFPRADRFFSAKAARAMADYEWTNISGG